MGEAKFKIGGVFSFQCFDKNGDLKWEASGHNTVTNEGLDHILDVVLHGTTAVSPWYVGLKLTGSEAAGDTLASHAGWTEFAASNYTGDRQAYDEAAASSQSTTNSANVASFAITGSGTVTGAFLCSAATGTSGTLLCVEDFSVSKAVANGDTLEVTYTISAEDD